ncbi:sigma factor-like helix-turn-helix DNA-binding protein [Paenibacillus agilis]|uniref:RNA polymerase sigma-70 region 4 domain-containing protein n=1 Tax=Paenibacillus agilis TaxID=3020863 RepID=A0A559IDA1_9BACL|nr:sigma factor-like helix-turn-helix DNA-binding protein [Paenibacillus agilis]TVX85642.1 hypothetical protein FPZ44_25160 [Paenibacillus agilis]
MAASKIEVFQKGCLSLWYGKARKNPRKIEKLNAQEEKEFYELLASRVAFVTDERKRDIICRHLGLNGYEKSTYAEIGLLHGISGSRVRELERKALPIIFRSIHEKWRSLINHAGGYSYE